MCEIVEGDVQVLIGRIEIDRHPIAQIEILDIVSKFVVETFDIVARRANIDEGYVHMVADGMHQGR